LKWEVVFPAQLMDLQGEAETSTAALDSGKSLECKLQKPYSYSCYLSGGRNAIGDGQVAVFHRIRTTAVVGQTALRVERAAATAADGKEEPLNNTESIVIIC
jgi:hypothetical protein